METLATQLFQALEGLESLLGLTAVGLESEALRSVARPEIALGLAMLWLLLRRRRGGGSSLAGDSDEILRRRFESGEVSRETYDRIRNRTHEAGK